MSKISPKKDSSTLQKTSLIKLRLKAMRSGIWYKALNRIDRALVNLTIQVANASIVSFSLVNRLRSVTSKLDELLESKLCRAAREIGVPLANKLSALARGWGNKSALLWDSEVGFARYLAAMKLNASCGWVM